MPTFEVDDQLHSHPKASAAGDEALGLWVRMGSWCMAYLTDGRVPRGLPLVVGKDSPLESLIKAGLLEVLENGDYQMHDWLHWQKPAKWWHQYRAKDAEKKKNKRALARAVSKCPLGTPSGTPHVNPPISSPGESPRSPSPSGSDPTDQANDKSEARPPAPPVLTPPVPKSTKRGLGKPKQQTLSVKFQQGVGWGIWRKLYSESRRNYGAYVEAPEDGAKMQTLVNTATEHALRELVDRRTPAEPALPLVEQILAHWFKAYLREDGKNGALADQRHPIRCVAVGIPTFGTPWSRARVRKPESTESLVVRSEALSPAEQSAAFQSLTAAVGNGGTH